MVWTTPNTGVAGDSPSAAEFNLYVRDNLNTTAPALATNDTTGRYFVCTGANALAEREVLSASKLTATSVTTTVSSATAFTGVDITGPFTTGALVFLDWSTQRTGTANGNASLNMHIQVDSVTEDSCLTRVFQNTATFGYYSYSWSAFVSMTAASHTVRAAYTVSWDSGANGDQLDINYVRMTVMPF